MYIYIYIVPTKEKCSIYTATNFVQTKSNERVPPLKMSSAPLSAFFRGRIWSQLPKRDVPLFVTDWYDPSFGSTSHSLPPGLRGTLKRSHYLQSGHPLQGSGSWRTWKNPWWLDQRHKSHKVLLKDPFFSRPWSIHVRNEPETRLVQAISNKYKPWIRQRLPQMFIQFTTW